MEDKIHLEKLVLGQLQEAHDREKRCEANIRQMERLLYVMRRERDDLSDERAKLELIVQDHRSGRSTSKKTDFEYGSRWNQLLFGASVCFVAPKSDRKSNHVDGKDDSDRDFENEDHFDELII